MKDAGTSIPWKSCCSPFLKIFEDVIQDLMKCVSLIMTFFSNSYRGFCLKLQNHNQQVYLLWQISFSGSLPRQWKRRCFEIPSKKNNLATSSLLYLSFLKQFYSDNSVWENTKCCNISFMLHNHPPLKQRYHSLRFLWSTW